MKHNPVSTSDRIEQIFENEELAILNLDPSGHFMPNCGCRGWLTVVKDSGVAPSWGWILSTVCDKGKAQLKPGKIMDTGVDFENDPCDSVYWSFVYSHDNLDTSNW